MYKTCGLRKVIDIWNMNGEGKSLGWIEIEGYYFKDDGSFYFRWPHSCYSKWRYRFHSVGSPIVAVSLRLLLLVGLILFLI